MKHTVIGIFDDDHVDRFIYERLFSNYSGRTQVHIFDNPASGIEKARQVEFDMVYIDLHFWRDFGGTAILQELKAVSKQNMISLAMTSLVQAGDHERVADAGFDLCLEKVDFFSGIDLVQLG